MWNGPAHVIFGHDARRGLQLESHATGLDTGCTFGKKLTCFALPSEEIIQVVRARKLRNLLAAPLSLSLCVCVCVCLSLSLSLSLCLCVCVRARACACQCLGFSCVQEL